MTAPGLRCASLPLLLAALASSGGAYAAGFPTEPSPAVVQPAPPALPAEPDRWLPFRVFDWRDGLGSPVNGLAIDGQGYLWAGNPNGVSKYNGHTWKPVDLPTDPPDAEVLQIFKASDGSLWLGTSTRGVFRLHKGAWSSFVVKGADGRWKQSTGLVAAFQPPPPPPAPKPTSSTGKKKAASKKGARSR